MVARILVFVVALAIVVLAAGWRSDDADCTTARQQAVAAAVGHAPPGGPEALADRLQRACRGGSYLAGSAGALMQAGDNVAAGTLLATAVRRSPDDWNAWFGLAVLLNKRGQQTESNRALARAHALNPRYRPAQRQLTGGGASGAQSASG